MPALRQTLRILHLILLGIVLLWSAGIVWYCLPLGWLFLTLYLGLIAAAVYYRRWKWSIPGLWALAAILNIGYLCITPTNDRPWLPSWSRLPYGTIQGNTLTLHDIRDFNYRSVDDYDVRYITQTYDLDQLRTLDFAVCHWDGMEAVAHTMLTFGFSDGRQLALSCETRLDSETPQGTIAGLYKRFGFIYIFATEPDIFALRSNYRHEDLYLYRFNMTPAQIRTVLTDFVERANALHKHPEFYNTLLHNCTTELLPSLKKATPGIRTNPIIILNGFIDQKAFDRGALQHRPGETFDQLKKRSFVPYDTSKNAPEHYSEAIRQHIGITEAS